MGNINIRTDLAVELNEAVDKSDSRYSGVIVREHIDKVSLVKVTTLEIINEEGEKLFNRKAGIYITIEAEGLGEDDDFYNERVIEIISGQIDTLIRPCISKNNKLLVVGLGNRNVTADSLGPDVVDKLIINSHIHGEKDEISVRLSALSPGVMAQTGIETSSIIKGIADEIDPGVIIVIDALAARNTQRLNKTIQISNRGINPGSGVGNHRTGITSDNIGVPVIAVGVPTVIDAATIIGDVTKDYENIPKHLSDMYVTPKDIDENIRITAEIIAESINELVYA
ncbi:MAG TPA: GPR endopeptidase [Eubacterium sp.]|nr:GPR endopeptidase [Eubacterium sp.]